VSVLQSEELRVRFSSTVALLLPSASPEFDLTMLTMVVIAAGTAALRAAWDKIS